MTPPDSTLQPDDDTLLDELLQTASTIQPDPVFTDRLRATLAGATPRPATEPSTVWQPTPAVTPSRPVIRPTPASRPRHTGHIATIAAIVAIMLVGYGALSLSGRSPSGLRLSFTDQPQASAQGVGSDINPIVGTWVAWANAFSATNMISSLMTFQPDGSLILQLLYQSGPQAAYGTWTSTGDTISFSYVIALDTSYDGVDLENIPLVPLLVQSGGTIRLIDGGRTWEDAGTEAVSLYIDRDGNPVTEQLPAIESDPRANLDRRTPSRLEDVLANAAALSPEQQQALDIFFGESDSSESVASPEASPTPLPTSTIPANNSPVLPTLTPNASPAA